MRSVLKTIFGLLFVAGALILLLETLGCNPTTTHSIVVETEDPLPPSECDFTEWEPNDTVESANFIDVLPVLGPRLICGNIDTFIGLGSTAYSESDTFLFSMYPAPRGTLTELNLHVFFKNPNIVPHLIFSQTDHDANGVIFVDDFYGAAGSLLILNYPIEYDEIYSHDLFIKLTHVGNPNSIIPPEDYTLEWWTN